MALAIRCPRGGVAEISNTQKPSEGGFVLSSGAVKKSMNLTPAALQGMDCVVDMTGASQTAALTNALRVYAEVLRIQASSRRLYVGDEDANDLTRWLVL
jgi:hypothetical protein